MFSRIPRRINTLFAAAFLSLLLASCGQEPAPETSVERSSTGEPRPDIYAEVSLTADLSYLTADEKAMIGLLIRAATIMDDLFWKQAYGDGHEQWLDTIADPDTRYFAELNYGPWDRLDNNRPFVAGTGPKPPGANFYPPDMTKEEFDAAYLPEKRSPYTLIRRGADGKLALLPYHVAYASELESAANLLREAAGFAESTDFANYLKLRANALISDDFHLSDLYWMDVTDNEIEFVVGPIESYEDKLFGYKTAYEAYVLIKDLDWSARLAKYATLLPQLQQGLPVADRYKLETPGSDSDLNAYDVVYYAGYANTGAKHIAVNLPNDEEVQLEKGTRRLQFKNAMQAKFETILEPIADELVDESQRQYVTFDAFFANTMLHEVAHGLGIKYTINDKGPVRDVMMDLASTMEEGKADVLGLYMVTALYDAGELGDVDLRDYYVTFMASIFRSVRFGASESHGRANMIRFNFFLDRGAIVRDSGSGRYRVDFDRMRDAMAELSSLLLTLQGDGDYAGASELTSEEGVIRPQLQADLDRLTQKGIPVDIVFNQGLAELGLDRAP